MTIVPVSCYNKGALLKLEIALARGRKDFQKRKYEKQKEYRLVFKKAVSKELINAFLKGIRLTEGIAKADKVTQIDKNELEVIIHQGWNRQLRRMAEACHYEIAHLIRTRIGDIKLENLKPGEWRKIK